MLGWIFIALGVALAWQGIGAFGWLPWVDRLVIDRFNTNVYCAIAGGVICKFGVLLGIVSCLMGVAYIIEKKFANDRQAQFKGYWGVLIFMIIAVGVSLL